MSEIEPVAPVDRLCIAVLGDLEGEHTRSWLRWFVARGHDVHAISYYPVRASLGGVRLHILKPGSAEASPGDRSGRSVRLPAGPMRLVHGARYWRAGLRRALHEINPDVFHGHFVVEHGFYGALAGFHPYVVTAWGSDVLVAPDVDPVTKQIARWTLARADAITSNNAYMADRIAALGARRDHVAIVTLGADAFFGEQWESSVNVRGREDGGGPVILSTRAHEPLYNIDEVIDAYAVVLRQWPGARLVVAHLGSLTEELREKAARIGGSARFPGTVPRERLRELMHDAEVFVSVPSSDGTSVALLQAMAAGAFPIVSDLATQREWIEDGVNGRRVALHDIAGLATAIGGALGDGEFRRKAAVLNRTIVAERGTNETQMLKMERLYRWLAHRARSHASA